MKIENKHYIAAAILLLALAWWFRYDTYCNSDNARSCVSYDRFTGNWVHPYLEAEIYYVNKENKS